jgi:hypothetical protein
MGGAGIEVWPTSNPQSATCALQSSAYPRSRRNLTRRGCHHERFVGPKGKFNVGVAQDGTEQRKGRRRTPTPVGTVNKRSDFIVAGRTTEAICRMRRTMSYGSVREPRWVSGGQHGAAAPGSE